MRSTAVCLLMISLGVGVAAQTPGPESASGAPPDKYTYNAGGRRDPFVSLLGTGAAPRLASNRAEGAAGLTVAEISVRGVMRSQTGLIAMVQGPDNKTYLVRQGDRFVDAAVKSITPQGLVLVQQVDEPLSLIKQREILKPLRSAEGAKQ
jgi:Tfp pilus assembly protein PilP